MKIPSRFRPLIVFTILATTAVQALRGADPEFYYYYHGAKRALELDETRIAVRLTSRKNTADTPSAAEAREFASRGLAFGYKQEDGKPFRPGGWIAVETKSAKERVSNAAQKTRKQKHKDMIDDLARLPDAEFVSPIFKDLKGNPVNLDSTLLIGFVDGTSEAVQSDTLQRIPHVQSMRRLGKKNNWVVETNFRNGLDLLDAANDLAALPIVRYADPNYHLVATLH